MSECSCNSVCVTSECISIGHITDGEGAVSLSELRIQLLFALLPTTLVHVEYGHLAQRTLLVHVYSALFKINPQNLCSMLTGHVIFEKWDLSRANKVAPQQPEMIRSQKEASESAHLD